MDEVIKQNSLVEASYDNKSWFTINNQELDRNMSELLDKYKHLRYITQVSKIDKKDIYK